MISSSSATSLKSLSDFFITLGTLSLLGTENITTGVGRGEGKKIKSAIGLGKVPSRIGEVLDRGYIGVIGRAEQ